MLAYERDDDASDVPEQAASTNANTKKKGKKSKSKTKSAKGKKQKGSGEKAVIGDTKGGERVHTLRNMPSQVFKNQATQDALKESFSSNHPKCLYCNEKARPAILMFNDCDWIDSEEQASRWDDWKLGLDKLINSRAYCCWDSKMGHKCDCVQVKTGTVDPVSSNEPVSVCVLEIGAGPNVTTVRATTILQRDHTIVLFPHFLSSLVCFDIFSRWRSVLFLFLTRIYHLFILILHGCIIRLFNRAFIRISLLHFFVGVLGNMEHEIASHIFLRHF
jgi:hypothetical protein